MQSTLHDYYLSFYSYIWDKVFKIGLSKFCGRQPLKNLKGCGLLKQNLLSPLLNTLSHMPQRKENKFKQNNQTYKDRCKEFESDFLCNIKKHESYLDIDIEELQNFDFVQSDNEEDNPEFSIVNSDFA